MKKILLICNHFAPDNTIAAIRTTKLAKYFVKEGFYVKVIAEYKNNQQEDDILKADAQDIDIVRVGNSDRCRKIINRYKRIIAPMKNKRLARTDNRIRINPRTGHKEFYPYETAYPFLGTLDYIVENYRQKDLFRQSRKYLKENSGYDILITSYGDRFSIYAGRYIKKSNRNIKWITDIRDAICRYKFTPEYMAANARRIEKYIERHADNIVTISEGIAKRVSEKYRNKVHIITNGYDLSDREGIDTVHADKSKLRFAYTGSMYGGLQDLSTCFKIISELAGEGKIDGNRIEIVYAGNEPAYNIFLGQAAKYNADKFCRYCGKISRRDSLKLQMDSDVLLLASYDYINGEGGVITGKALEYMSAGKPVITVITGDIVNSELRRIMEECNLGCVYEEACMETDYLRMKEYIAKIYLQFANGEKLTFEPDYEALKKYDYVNISRKYTELINEGK